MSKPKGFLVQFVASKYRIDMIDSILYGWVERAKHENSGITDTKAIQDFLDHYDMNDEWGQDWANVCLNRFKLAMKAGGNKL